MTGVHEKPIDRLDQDGLIDQLADVLAAKDINHRAAMLRRVTDLFVLGSGRLTEEQIALFDDVMARLVEEIDTAVRANFGHVLASLPDAPPKVVRRLALDDAIDVAKPILLRSVRVDNATLVEGAKTKSQEHLLAISQRDTLVASVTDILIKRGNKQVVLSAVRNPGAAFSELGYSMLVRRSSCDYDLAVCVWSRPEIPRQHLLKLFADASESVRRELTKKDPSKASLILEVVAHASNQIQTRTRERSLSYAAAHARVYSLSEKGELCEAQLAEFARSQEFDETIVTLSIICDLPVGLIERAFIDERSEQIIVLARAADLSWDTVKAILLLQARTKEMSKHKFDRHLETFVQLKAETAKKAINFYRMRERARVSRLN